MYVPIPEIQEMCLEIVVLLYINAFTSLPLDETRL